MKARTLVCLLLIVSLLAPTASYARWMNPSTGRFHTMDTFEGRQTDPQSLHKYLYCEADPVNNADPTGCDIGEMLSVEGITGRLMAMAAPATAKAGVAGGVWGTPGPDVTMAVMKP